MRLPVSVLKEALSSFCQWEFDGSDPEVMFSFPRQFDGTGGTPGHVFVIPPGSAVTAELFPETGLAVFAFPCEKRTDLSCPVLRPAREVPEEGIMQLLTELYDSVEDWEAALDACSSDLAGIRKMLEITAELTGGSIGLVDVTYNMPAYTETMKGRLPIVQDGAASRVSDSGIEILADDPEIFAVRSACGVQLFENTLGGEGTGACLFRNMFRPGEDTYYNRLLFIRDSEIYSCQDRFVVERLSQRIERITEHLSTWSMPESEYSLMQRVILQIPEEGYVYDAAARTALDALHWEEAGTYRFYIFQSLYPERDTGITDYMLRRIEELIPDSCGTVDGKRILLIQHCPGKPRSPEAGKDGLEGLRPKLVEFLRENIYRAGISGRVLSFSQMQGAYRQAKAAWQMGSTRDPMFWYYLFEDYRQDYILRKAAQDIPAELLLRPAVGVLLRHDAERGTHFIETLQALAAENFNITGAARRLYIHRTSLQDRIERIRAVSGLDTDHAETRFDLLFSLRLLAADREQGLRQA